MTGRCAEGNCLLCLDCRARALHAWDERIRLLTTLDDLRRDLRLARRHLDNCPTAVAVAEHTSDKRRDDQ